VSAQLQQLYRDLVLDHSQHPRHFGRLEDATHMADGINPLCGDKLRLYLRVGENGAIESSRFEGSGCAISVASASLMTDAVTGLQVDHARECIEEVTARLTSGATDVPSLELKKLAALDGVRQYPGRVKCATLAWRALDAALNHDTTPATTEQDA
jgi:nitrogen fixation NifU-like protein